MLTTINSPFWTPNMLGHVSNHSLLNNNTKINLTNNPNNHSFNFNITDSLISPPRPLGYDVVTRIEARIKTVLYVVYGVITPSLIAIGMICNILTLKILVRLMSPVSVNTSTGRVGGEKRPQNSIVPSYYYLGCMTVSDMFYSFFYVFNPIIYYNAKVLHPSRLIYALAYLRYILFINAPCSNAMNKISCLMVLMITIDRYLALHKAMTYRQLCTRKLVFTSIGFCVGLAFVLTSVQGIQYVPVKRTFTQSGGYNKFYITQRSLHPKFVLTIFVAAVVKEVLTTIGPVLVITVLSIKIVTAYWAIYSKRKNMILSSVIVSNTINGTVTNQKILTQSNVPPSNNVTANTGGSKGMTDREMALFMVSIIISYTVSQIPFAARLLLELWVPLLFLHVAFNVFTHLTGMLTVVQGTLNFVLFIYLNKTFQRELLEMIRGWRMVLHRTFFCCACCDEKKLNGDIVIIELGK